MSAALLLLALAAHGLADRRMTSPVGARQSTDVAGLPGVGCVCVPYYQCEDSPNVNRGDIDIIDIRDNDDRCSHYLDVCCKSLKMRPSPGGSQPSTEFPHPTPPPSQQPCGQRSPGGVGFRITGGDSGEAQFGEFPWMVAILEQRRVAGIDRPINAYLCGGALILAQVVITAAHCIAGKDPAQLWVRAGEWDTQTTKELYPHQDRKGAQVIAHPRYRPRTLHNDVALLVMLDPVRLGGHVGLVCLPPQGQPFDRSRCTASGWGKDKFEQDGQYKVIMKKRDLPVIPNPECQALLRKTRLGAHFLLDASFICAGGKSGQDTCTGDGGSPLVCPTDRDPGRYYQAGIVAWGIDCGRAGTPGVYVSVARYRDWIDSEMSRLRVDTSGYEA